MSENHIFSYDFFINGLFGLSIFFIFTAFFLLLYGLFLSAFVIFIIEIIKKYRTKEHKFSGFWILFFLTLLINILFQYISCHKLSLKVFMVMNFFSLFINIHIGSLLLCNAKIKLITLSVLIVSIFYSITTFPYIISNLVEVGLKNFNSGGKVLVNITTENNFKPIVTKGNLILLTPNKIFVDFNRTIKIMDRDEKVIDILKY